MDKQLLREFVESNPKLVKMRPAGDGLFVLKYTKHVFFKDLWNDYLEECRGLIVDKDWNIVSRPFTKVYNYGVESKAPVLDDSTLVTAYRKINGFMVALTWHRGDVLVSTTGNTDSPYVAMAREMMQKHMCWADWQLELCPHEGATFMFECVHPDDPHIVPEKPGMYFLGYRENTWDSRVKGFSVDIAQSWQQFAEDVLQCYAPESYVLPLGELKDRVRECRHEGFVFYTKDNLSSKIKSQFYLVNKWVARNPRTDKIMREDFKNSIDEEYYPLVDAIRANIDVYTALDEQARLAWVRGQLGV